MSATIMIPVYASGFFCRDCPRLTVEEHRLETSNGESVETIRACRYIRSCDKAIDLYKQNVLPG